MSCHVCVFLSSGFWPGQQSENVLCPRLYTAPLCSPGVCVWLDIQCYYSSSYGDLVSSLLFVFKEAALQVTCTYSP